jgi:hypothetical protein
MSFVRRISAVFLAGALAAPALMPVRADAAPADRKAEKAQRPAQADRPRPAGERPGVMLERMKQQILSMDLSADQKRQIEELFAKAQDDLASERRQTGEKDLAKFREKAQSTVRELRQKVVGLLNEEQRQSLRRKFQTAQDNAVQGGEMMAERVKNALKSVELSDEQEHKLDALLADSQKKARELTERTQSQMRELMQETRAKVEALLTEEQRQKMKASRPNPNRKPERGGESGTSKPKANAPDDRL